MKTLAFSPDGRVLAAVTIEGHLTLWDVPSRSRLRSLAAGGGRYILVGVGFSPDGATLFTTNDLGGVKLVEFLASEKFV